MAVTQQFAQPRKSVVVTSAAVFTWQVIFWCWERYLRGVVPVSGICLSVCLSGCTAWQVCHALHYFVLFHNLLCWVVSLHCYSLDKNDSRFILCTHETSRFTSLLHKLCHVKQTEPRPAPHCRVSPSEFKSMIPGLYVLCLCLLLYSQILSTKKPENF